MRYAIHVGLYSQTVVVRGFNQTTKICGLHMIWCNFGRIMTTLQAEHRRATARTPKGGERRRGALFLSAASQHRQRFGGCQGASRRPRRRDPERCPQPDELDRVSSQFKRARADSSAVPGKPKQQQTKTEAAGAKGAERAAGGKRRRSHPSRDFVPGKCEREMFRLVSWWCYAFTQCVPIWYVHARDFFFSFPSSTPEPPRLDEQRRHSVTLLSSRASCITHTRHTGRVRSRAPCRGEGGGF